MIVMIDGPIISRFIENSEEFSKYADERFEKIDEDRKKGGFAKSIALDHDESQDCDDRFEAFDRDGFKAALKEMMVAVAQGIGNSTVSVIVEEGSLLVKAYELEIEITTGVVKNNREMIEATENGELEIVSPKRMKKKRSLNFLSFCACSGNYYAENS